MPAKRPSLQNARPRANLTIPELEHAKAAALGTLVSLHSRRAYKNAIDKFTTWYCSEPRLGFNRAVVLRYRSFLESLSLSAATINLHLSAIRRLADEAAESSMLSPELAIGIRRVKGVKRLGGRVGNWLSSDQAQDLLNSIPRNTMRGRRDAALIGLLLGCGLRRSEAVALRIRCTVPLFGRRRDRARIESVRVRLQRRGRAERRYGEGHAVPGDPLRSAWHIALLLSKQHPERSHDSVRSCFSGFA
jgi:site-specific recombinase XerC